MRNHFRQSGQILIIYLTTLFVGGSSLAVGVIAAGKSIDDLMKSAEVVIADSDREKQAMDLFNQWQEEGKSIKEDYSGQRERLLSLIKDHSAKKESFETEIEQLLAFDQSASQRILDIQYELRKTMTKSEWDKVMSSN